jgi:hypothetical protein
MNMPDKRSPFSVDADDERSISSEYDSFTPHTRLNHQYKEFEGIHLTAHSAHKIAIIDLLEILRLAALFGDLDNITVLVKELDNRNIKNDKGQNIDWREPLGKDLRYVYPYNGLEQAPATLIEDIGSNRSHYLTRVLDILKPLRNHAITAEEIATIEAQLDAMSSGSKEDSYADITPWQSSSSESEKETALAAPDSKKSERQVGTKCHYSAVRLLSPEGSSRKKPRHDDFESTPSDSDYYSSSS